MLVSYIVPFCLHTCLFKLDSSLSSLIPESDLIDQLILVYDGSKEELVTELPIPSEFHNKASLVFTGRNLGPGFARNYGSLFSSSRYLFFLDAGDINHPNRTSLQLNQLSNSHICFSAIQEFISSPSLPTSKRFPVNSNLLAILLLPFRNPANNVTLAIKRDLFISLGGYPPLRLAEDWVLVSKILASFSPISFDPSVLVFVDVGGDFAHRRLGFRHISNLTKAYSLIFLQFPLLLPFLLFGLFLNISLRIPSSRRYSAFIYTLLRKS